MDFTGDFRVPAPIGRVWDGINDPEILKQCIDGCEDLTKTSDTEFAGKVKVKVGPVSARFAGTVTMEEVNAPTSCVLAVKGQGGVAGFAKGTAKVTLVAEGAETLLSYEAKAEVGGKLASVGARLVRGVADKTANDFFARFSGLVAGGATPAAEPVVEEAAPTPVAEPVVVAPVTETVAAPFVPVAVTVAGPAPVDDSVPITGSTVVVAGAWAAIGGILGLVVLISLLG
jgi:carbon monoxide dehydrogenase subunit G